MRPIVVATAVLLTLGACSSADEDAGYDREGWDETRLAELETVAQPVVASDIGCVDLQPDPWGPFVMSYREADLPMPAASMACASNDEEDLTFEAFASTGAKQDFVEAKAALLCARGYDLSPEFPGLPYVDGGTWIIEPDTTATADRLAELLGGDVTSTTMCSPPV